MSDLKGLPVLLSASLPEELVGRGRAQDLYDLLVVLTGGILSHGGRLVFGGHPSVTPLVHRVAISLGPAEGQILLFQAEQFRSTAPPQIQDRRVFGDVQWCKDPQTMREEMIRASEAGVFVGGKTTPGHEGNKPGVRDEFERFVRQHPEGPVYLMGILGGESQRIIEETTGEPSWEPRSLTKEEKALLHRTDSVDVAASLILADLTRTFQHSPH